MKSCQLPTSPSRPWRDQPGASFPKGLSFAHVSANLNTHLQQRDHLVTRPCTEFGHDDLVMEWAEMLADPNVILDL